MGRGVLTAPVMRLSQATREFYLGFARVAGRLAGLASALDYVYKPMGTALPVYARQP